MKGIQMRIKTLLCLSIIHVLSHPVVITAVGEFTEVKNKMQTIEVP